MIHKCKFCGKVIELIKLGKVTQLDIFGGAKKELQGYKIPDHIHKGESYKCPNSGKKIIK